MPQSLARSQCSETGNSHDDVGDGSDVVSKLSSSVLPWIREFNKDQMGLLRFCVPWRKSIESLHFPVLERITQNMRAHFFFF